MDRDAAQVLVRLDADEARDLDRMAKLYKITRPQVLRYLLRLHVQREKNRARR